MKKGQKSEAQASCGACAGIRGIGFRVFFRGKGCIVGEPLVHFMDHRLVCSFLGSENGAAAFFSAERVGHVASNAESAVF